jgi:hypothetical protein
VRFPCFRTTTNRRRNCWGGAKIQTELKSHFDYPWPKHQPRLSNGDEGETEEAEDEALAAEQMLAVLENVALHGKALLGSSEYQLLKKKGFYITSITWKSKQTDSSFNIVEFDAGFEEPKEGKSFRYNVRGIYRNKDGAFTKTLIPLSTAHKDQIFPIVEQTALKALAALRSKATADVTMPEDGSQS